MQGLPCNASARAPGGTLLMWARALRAPRSLCGVDSFERRGTGTTSLPNSQLRRPAPKRDALEAVVQADPGLRNAAGQMGWGTISDEDLRSRGLWNG